MVRLPRFVVPGQPQHVIVRGNNRSAIFCANEDYVFYRDKLRDACIKHGCELHAYVLMTNHVHFLMTPHDEIGISKVIQMLGRYYVQYYNYCYQRIGTLWEGRYKAALIDSESYLLICMRYIELNPVRASMVASPADYPWSSYRCNAQGADDSLVVPHDEYLRLGKSIEDCQALYRKLFRHHIAEAMLEELRDTTNKGWVLGSDRFKQQIKRHLERRVEPVARGGDRRSHRFRGDESE
jgi:putative transposase